MDRARAPERTLRAWNPFLVEGLADLLGRAARDVVAKDATDNGSFLDDDFALARNRAVLKSPNDAVAVAETASSSTGSDNVVKHSSRSR